MGNYDRLHFAQPHQLYAVLGKIPNGSEVYITDLGVNPSTLDRVIEQIRRIINSGGKVYWFDHHVWDESWIKTVKDLGVNLFIDRSTCTAGVVAKYLNVSGEGVDVLVKATCSLDLWRFDHWLGNYLGKVVGYKGGSKWKEYIVKKLVNFKGVLDNELLQVVEEEISKELKIMSKVLKKAHVTRHGNLIIAYYFKSDDEHITSYIAHLLMSRFNADIAVICRKGSISLRSKAYNVRELAKVLGGGGHPRAAGAPLRPPLIIRILSFIGIRRPHLEWCITKVKKALDKLLGRHY